MKQIVLRQGGWTAVIDPSRGGNVTGLYCDGQPILAPEGACQDAYLVGAPLLLPANRTSHGAFSHGGISYTLPINEPGRDNHLHGLVHNAPFSLLQVNADSVTVELCNHGLYYPFPFRLRVEYALSGRGFESVYTLENTGEADMPVVFGLHTTFVARGTIRIPLGPAQQRDERCLPTGLLRPLTPAEEALCGGCPPPAEPISGYYLAAGKIARVGSYVYRVSDNFDHWILYNNGGKGDVFCVEPQCGGVNGLNTGECSVISGFGRMVWKTSIFKQPEDADS